MPNRYSVHLDGLRRQDGTDQKGPNMTDDRIWQLHHADATIAELVVTDADFPWLHATVRPGPGFDVLRPLFDDEVRLSEDDDDVAWEAAYDRIRQAVSLIAPDGQAVPEFLLHIDGQDAWWRWSDEPFPRDK